MSAYLCFPHVIANAANAAGLRVADVARLNLNAVAWRFNCTPSEAVRVFTGCKSAKEYVRECENAVLPANFLDRQTFDLGDVIYQCAEGDYVKTKTFKALRQAVKEKEEYGKLCKEGIG